jgi:hypothetical protein
MSEGAEGSQGTSASKQVAPIKRWLESFAVELYHTNLFFWLRGHSTASKNLLLSGFAGAVILYARKSHADYATISSGPRVVVTVIIGCLVASFFVCLLDPKLRTDQNAYLTNAVRCYQLITVGALISAAAISVNHFWRWSEKISYAYSLDGFDEIAWAFSAPAAFSSLLIILYLSILRAEFRDAARSDLVRVFAWSLTALLLIFIVDLAMFDFGSQSVSRE